MPKNQPISHQPNAGATLAHTAAIYARVSSVGQLGRDGDEDGYSLPAQVEACKREAISRGAEIVKVYMERAESAKSDDRPVLQQMMRELPSLGVKYLILHKVDRLARNRLDDAMLCQRLVGMGVTLVSATENIDETPAGRLMHGMLASFAEYYSNNLGAEVKKGLNRKHEQGGTPCKPPIGYLSKRELIGGKDIRSVILDPVRAPLIKLAFDLYATGQWALHRLADHLEEQGLRSRGTARFPERPLGHNRIHEMLRNRYYIGIVEWDGRSYPGKHDKLVDQETFDQVQVLLAAARIAGDRAQVHEHYLRATVVCDRCRGRLLFGRHRSRSGQHYEYFCCTNRATRRKRVQCESGHYSVPTVEHHIENLYRTLHIKPEVQETIRREVREELHDRAALIQAEAERHERALKAIEAKQEKLVQLYYRDLVSEDILEAEQEKLKTERRAAERLRHAASIQLEDVENALEEALRRVDHPHQSYLEGTPLERRVMNKSIFVRIEVGDAGEIASTTLTPTYNALAAWQPTLGRPTAAQPGTKAEAGPRPAYVRPSSAAVHSKIQCWRAFRDLVWGQARAS
jgi:site-specific DNA recombinase